MPRPRLSPAVSYEPPTSVKLGPVRAEAERVAREEGIGMGELIRRGVALYVRLAPSRSVPLALVVGRLDSHARR